MDQEPVRLYNASCPQLPELLRALRRGSATAPVWRRLLILTLQRMGHGQPALARVTAVEALMVLNVQAGSLTYPRSATARARAERLQGMRRRRYSRGALTPAAGHHPEVLHLMIRRAQKALEPLDRNAAEALWRKWGGGRFDRVWQEVQRCGTPRGRAYAFVAAAWANDNVESLKKTLRRERQRIEGQQTR